MDQARTVPQAFLSLSGIDDSFVEKVFRHLPEGLAFFYRRSFKNGQALLDAMEAAVDQSSVFVLFASPASLQSVWVHFEISRARLAALQRPTFRILVFPLTPELSTSSLPSWMQEFWVPKAGFAPRDIARFIRNVITSPPIASPAVAIPVIGRGQFLDVATQRMSMALADAGTTPNVFVFAGISGIGRRTFARYFMQQALPTFPDLAKGPELHLAQFADLADLYRAIREQVETNFSPEQYKEDAAEFQQLTTDGQVEEVILSLRHFARLGQAVFVATGSGLFEERGDVKQWVRFLITQLASEPELKLCLISNRQIPEQDALSWSNLLQLYVPPLKDNDTKTLMIMTSVAFGLNPIAPNDGLVRAIGGHAQIAKAAVRLVVQKGEYFLKRDPSSLFSIQDEVLSENLQVDALTSIQQEILCMLSWVPQLHGRILEEVCVQRHGIISSDFIKEIDSLLLGCLILVSEDNLMISSAIRQMFRRRYGYGPNGLLADFASSLRKAWGMYIAQHEFSSDLFDAFVFMHALEGRSLPKELRDLLLPSTLAAVMRETYARGRDDDEPDALRRVTTWGTAVDEMKMDEPVREEILSIVVQAHVRLSEFGRAEEILRTFDKRGYRSVSFLRGFALRRRGRYRDAVPYLKDAVDMRRWDRASVQELAVCYQKLGMPDAISRLVEEHDRVVYSSASLLDFKIGALIAAGKMREAETAIEKLKLLPEDEGRAAVRQAQILIQRDHDPKAAIDILSGLVDKRIGNAVTVRRFRAIAAANAGNFQLARRDIDFIRGRPGRQETAQRLEVYYGLANHDYAQARKLLEGLRDSEHDGLLMARILEAEAADPNTPLANRKRLRDSALEIRARNQNRSEFEFD
jgi:hypothetical protein